MIFGKKSTYCSFLMVIVSIITILSLFSGSVAEFTTKVSMTRLRAIQDFPYTIQCDKVKEQDACERFCGPGGSCTKIRIEETVSYSFCRCNKKPTIDENGYSCTHEKTTAGKCPYVCGGSGSTPYTCQFEDFKKKSSSNVKSYCVCVNPNNDF